MTSITPFDWKTFFTWDISFVDFVFGPYMSAHRINISARRLDWNDCEVCGGWKENAVREVALTILVEVRQLG
jgi:hypothetical protein